MEQIKQNSRKQKFQKENVRTAVSMAWPSIVESFFAAFAGLVDSLMVSSLGSYAVAAVGLTTQPKFMGYPCFLHLMLRFLHWWHEDGDRTSRPRQTGFCIRH